MTNSPTATLADLRAALASPRGAVLDVLPAEAYRAGHIPGAVNLPFEELQTALAKRDERLPATDFELITYCTGPD